MQPDESLAIATRVKKMLARHDVPERKQAGQLAMVLQISPQSAYKKLGGQMQWSIDDVFAIARAMGERPGSLLDDWEEAGFEPGEFECNGVKLACLVKTGPPGHGTRDAQFVALRDGNLWRVHLSAHSPTGDLVVVEEILIRPAGPAKSQLRIAIVDDEPDTAESIADFLENRGFQAVTLSSVKELQAELERRPFDGYVIDWYLDGATAADCVRLIRKLATDNAPIFLLTGKIDTGPDSESDIARVMVEFGLRRPFEKPYRLEFIAAELNKEIKDSLGGASAGA